MVGAEEAGPDTNEEVIEVGEEVTEKISEEVEAEKPNVSITDLIADADDVEDEQEDKPHADGFVPVDKHLKLRERAQAAEARVKQLESQTTRTDAENSGPEIDDDDFLTGKDARQLAAQIEAKADAKADARYKQQRAKDLIDAKTTKAEADQDIIAAERPDYYDVIGAMQNVQLSPKAKAEIRNADNAAEKAYEIGCQILNRQPVQKRTPTNTPTNENINNAELSEEEQIFDDIYS
jgi:hypothetical protein